ncbi:MAG: L,D-transpeptidase family protein [Microbacterium sp.]
MTDLISAPDATEKIVEESSDASATDELTSDPDTASMPASADDQPLAWAPLEPKPKKKRLGLWIGLGLGVCALGAGAASMVLIAPGTTVAGIPVGWMTPGAAADAINNHLAQTTVTLTGEGDGEVLTGADLGASLDARELADEAFASHPMWNVTAWGQTVPASIALDPEKADEALRDAVPTSFDDPVDAAITFDPDAGTYVVSPSESGTEIDVAALTDAIAAGIADGDNSIEFSGDPTTALPSVTDEDATAIATSLNTTLSTIGFYIGDERTVPVDAATAATWLTIVDTDGTLSIEADEAAIQETVDTLPKLVDRAPVNEASVTNSAGKVLRSETEGVTGRALTDTSDIASEFADQLENGDGIYDLTVTETPFQSVKLLRTADVNLSTQTASFYENGKLVNSWKISSGAAGHETKTGNFTIRAHVPIQDMVGADYVTKDVPWVTYFNGDQAFHGTYWHNNFGHQMSHGCVNMPISAAKWVYDWAPDGVEVSVHY